MLKKKVKKLHTKRKFKWDLLCPKMVNKNNKKSRHKNDL